MLLCSPAQLEQTRCYACTGWELLALGDGPAGSLGAGRGYATLPFSLQLSNGSLHAGTPSLPSAGSSGTAFLAAERHSTLP